MVGLRGDPIKWKGTKRRAERSVHVRRMFSSNFTRRGNSRSRFGGAGSSFSEDFSTEVSRGKNSRYRASWRRERALLESVTRV